MASADTHYRCADAENDAEIGSDEEDEVWEDDGDEEEADILAGPVTCLFCDTVLQSADSIFDHCRKSHQFDIGHFAAQWRLDCISYIKMINYVRKQKPSCESFKQSEQPFPWESDEFMQPVDQEDLLLQFDIESQNFADTRDMQGETTAEGRAAAAETRARQAEEELKRAVADLETVRSFMKTLMSESNVADTAPSIQNLKADEDEAYFSSYSHFGIHQEMLADRVRTDSYRELILKNKHLFKGKVVLDVGCGTGILSMFAAQAGAERVISVDQSEIIYKAMDIVRCNGFRDKITFVKGRLEDIKLPVEKVDIIISEWMGYFLLFESMLDTILFARDKYLKDGGIVFPDRCSISLVGSGDLDLYRKHVAFWDNVYGFNMSCMKTEVVPEAIMQIVEADRCITESSIVKELDVCECKLEDLQFESNFALGVKEDGSLTALVGYFDIFFEKGCENKVSFSTSPWDTATHWSQTVFLLPQPRSVKKGEVLDGKLTCRKDRKNPRGLRVTIVLAGTKQEYFMS